MISSEKATYNGTLPQAVIPCANRKNESKVLLPAKLTLGCHFLPVAPWGKGKQFTVGGAEPRTCVSGKELHPLSLLRRWETTDHWAWRETTQLSPLGGAGLAAHPTLA